MLCAVYAYEVAYLKAGRRYCPDQKGGEVPCPPRGRAFYGPELAYNVTPSYTKLDGRGIELPDSAPAWAMVKDNNTGLIWEVKEALDGVKNYANPRDGDNNYTWYDGNPLTNGGNPGRESGPRDTESFLQTMNAARFGGYADWRLPTLGELFSLVNHDFFIPAIDGRYFPHTKSAHYWSATSAGISSGAWGVDFAYGFDGSYYKGYYFYVRAVRGGRR